MDKPRTRPMCIDDAAEVCRLCAQLGYPGTVETMQTRIGALTTSGRHLLVVAEHVPDRLAGWASAERRLLLTGDERVEITGLVVDDAVRRRHVGRCLVETVEAWCAGIGLDTVFLRSNVARDAAHPFYESLGYTRTKTQHAYRRMLKPGTGPASP